MREHRENNKRVSQDWDGDSSFRDSRYDKPLPAQQSDDHEEEETMQVLYNYVPNLQDEVYLYVGDPVIVKAKFDDGWALGFNLTTKQEGSFPLACVGPFNNGQRGSGDANIQSRHSSLYLPSMAQEYYEDEDGESNYTSYDEEY